MKDDRLYLIHIQECIGRIEMYLSNVSQEKFFESSLMQDAIIRNLQVLSESTQRLSDRAKESRPDVEWYRIAGFRNILVHDYLGVDLETVWNIAKVEMPMLKKVIDEMLRQ